MERLKATIRKYAKILAGAAVVAALFIAMPLLAIASDAFPLPEMDPAQLLLSLATNYKALGVLGVLSGMTLLSSFAINSWVPETFKWKRLISLGVAMVYSALAALLSPAGSAAASVAGVLIMGLLAKGGASEIYEALKGAGVIKKPVAVIKKPVAG